MTNEEKAREIALSIRFNVKGNEWIFTAIEEYCKSMAEWKDRQFKEYLEKLKDKCYKEYRKLASKSNDEYAEGEREAYGRLCMVVEIINELFSEEETDESDNDE